MNTATNKLSKLTATILLLATLALATAAQAAKLELGVVVRNYGFVVVKPGSNTGGAIRWDGSQYYTDRVNRGELVYIFAFPGVNEQAGGALWDVYCESQNRQITGLNWMNWDGYEWSTSYVVPIDPSKDNLYVQVYTSSSAPQIRIPIGFRNP